MYSQTELKKIVNTALVNLTLNSESDRLIDPVKYVLSMGGKRIRPVLALMACNIFSDKINEAIIPATGLEIFHNFTLIHDDVMDKAPVRRGFPTVHTKWNLNQAILSGDVMAFITNDCFLQSPALILPKVLKTFNKAAIDVCVGQQLDMDFEKATIVALDEYTRMIELKTAALIAASARIGAVLGGADDRDADLIYEYGRNLGLAFQIQDDILDVYGDMKVFGKTSGGDIIAGKKTFLFVKALEAGSLDQRKKLQNLYISEEFGPEEKVQMVKDIYNELNIMHISEKVVAGYLKTATDLLEKVSVAHDRKTELTELTGSLSNRDH